MMCRSKAEGGRRCRGRKGRGPSGPAGSRGGSAPPGPSGRRRRSREAVLQAMQKQVGDLLDAAVDAAPGDSAAALGAVAADVASQFADAITAPLEAHGCPRGSWQDHLLCGALAAVARAMETGKDQAKTAVNKGVTAALAACGVPRPAAVLAGRSAADVLTKLPTARQYQNAYRAVQALAVVECPALADHPEVERYCLQPIASALLSSAIQGELAESTSCVRSVAAMRGGGC